MKRDKQQGVVLSILDRLIDTEPGVADRMWSSRAESLGQLKNSVRRDLEWILNTRRGRSVNPSLQALNRSVFVYGMPDLATYTLDSASDRARLKRELTTVIERFEPRLQAINIVSIEEERVAHALQFRIEALLRTESAVEPVSFDTVLELSSGEYQVRGEG
jgi:type VI secretion system protein ImpF